jgi:hypothetical protein
MQLKKGTYFLLFLTITFVSCVKYANDTTATPGLTPDALPVIKFFNVVDQGTVRVKLNSNLVDSVPQFYPTAYVTAKADSNNIQVYNMRNLDTTLLNINLPLLKGNYYSCFIYKQGYDWKVSIVNDKLIVPDSGFAGIRILDFRTQAITNYVNIKVFDLGFFTYGDVAPFTYRHFLDHTSYDVLTRFVPVYARPDYNIVVYNSTANLASRSSIEFKTKKLYSIILMTPQSIVSDTTANKYLFSDVEPHN